MAFFSVERSLTSTMLFIAYMLSCSLIVSAQVTDSTQASKYLQEAQVLLDTLDYEAAIQLSNQALSFYQKSASPTAKIGVAYALLGDAYREQGQYDAALEAYVQAKDSFLQNYGSSHAAIAQANNDIGLCYWKKGEIQEAVQSFEIALNERIEIFGEQHPKVADSYNNLGNCSFDQRDLNNARSFYEKALAIRLELLDADDPDIASSYNNLCSCYRFAGQYEIAIEYCEKSIKIRENKLGKMHPKVAQSCSSLGQCYEQMAQIEEAITYYNRSLRIRQEHYKEDHPDIANAFIDLGGCYSKASNHSLALKYFEKALAIQKVNFPADSPNLISVYNNLANAYKNAGDYNKAMLFYENNIAILNQSLGPQHPFTAATYNNIGLIQVALVDFDQALLSYRKALDIYENQGNQQRIASTWNNIGTCLRQQKRFPQAIQAYQQSIGIFNKINGGSAATATAYYNIGNCLGEEQDYANALQYYDQAIALVTTTYGENSPRLAIYKTSIGTIHHKQGDYQKAVKQFDEALGLLNVSIKEEASYIETPIEVLNLLNAKTKTLYKFNTVATLQEALQITDFSIQIIANLRQEIQEDYSKRKLGETAHETFHLGISICHRLYQQIKEKTFLEKAFTYSEKSRSNLILSALLNQQAASFANIPDSLLALENQLKTSITYHEKQQQSFVAKKETTASDSDQNTSILFEKKQAYNQLVRQFESDYPAYYQLKYDDYTVPVGDIQQKLSAEEALIEYFVTDTAVYVFLIKQKDLQLKEILVDSLVKEVKLFREGITRYYIDIDAQTEEGYRYLLIQYFKTAHFFYQKLIEPIVADLPEKLTIVNGGVLNYVPFDALVSSLPEGKIHRLRDIDFLIKKHEINYAYSATLSHKSQVKENDLKSSKKLLAFAPAFSVPNRLQLAPLAHNIPEVELIKATIPDSDLFVRAAATKQKFLAQASVYEILHLATHGQSNTELGDFSFLAFSDEAGGPVEEALLYAREIYNLSLTANLVVLSACETGKGELLQGEGVVSLASAFFYAGAKSVITTLWSINDASTKIIMGSFYQALEEGASKGEALRIAKLQYIAQADDPNPFFWAAFTLTGDTERLPNNTSSLGRSVLYFFGCVAGLMLLVFWMERYLS